MCKHILTYSITLINSEFSRRKILPKKASTDKIRESDDLFLAKILFYYYLSLKIIQFLYEKVLAFVSDFHMCNLNNKFPDFHVTFIHVLTIGLKV